MEQVRAAVEKSNERVYGSKKVLHFYDSRRKEEKTAAKAARK